MMKLTDKLNALANNLWWSWQPQGLPLWRELLGPDFELNGSNPVPGLGKIVESEITPEAAQLTHNLYEGLQEYLKSENTWYSRLGTELSGPVAYFCAEFGLHESLAIYSGGLGVLAGDHLKSASDLGIPLIGIGLLYRRGYVRQEIDATGWQQSQFPSYDFADLAVKPVLGPDGAVVTVHVPIDGANCTCQVWQVNVGRVTLYLLDTDLEANPHHLRELTAQLYGGDSEMRIQQELLLGVGGVRVLDKLSITPAVFHLNEGHSSFSSLERMRTWLESNPGATVRDARAEIAKNSVFTTHTPVEAGHDRFYPQLAAKYLSWMCEPLGLEMHELLALGRWPQEHNPEADFNMTLCALGTANWVNGVAALHGKVSREMFARYWPGKAVDEVPIGHVTNGVHHRTWQAPVIRALANGASLENPRQYQEAVEGIDDGALWAAKNELRSELVGFCKERVERRAARVGGDGSLKFTPDALTIGFARRFATYKRANLLFRDIDRLIHILETAPGPVQFVFAGKAHPADHGGKTLIQQVYWASQNDRLKGRVLLLEDYDISIGRALVKGVDVWLNNPRRPKEASGTSGMKASMNGGLNLSILDGWWPEGYNQSNGWVIGDESPKGSIEDQDNFDANCLYDMLQHTVIPEFYDRDANGIPQEWTRMMKSAISSVTPQFASDRQVRDYMTQLYGPAFKSNQ